MCVSALLLFLALVSYSPLDPSLNSASVLTGAHAARNWIGVVGALISDLVLQFFGIGAFLLPIFPAMLGCAGLRSTKDSVSRWRRAWEESGWRCSFLRCWRCCRDNMRWLGVIPSKAFWAACWAMC
jgi:uncharacterized membrane protein YuzA (DUF378 family)